MKENESFRRNATPIGHFVYQTKLFILFLIAAEQKVRAPQTMPEVKTDQNILEAGGCSWRDEVVDNGYTWNPRVLPFGEVQCVSCTCKVNLDISIYFHGYLSLHPLTCQSMCPT